jgi:hypothetical protein
MPQQRIVEVRDFDDVIAIAATRKGGLATLEKSLAETSAVEPSVLAERPDDLILAEMSRRILYAG